jgi:hypothetical protein
MRAARQRERQQQSAGQVNRNHEIAEEKFARAGAYVMSRRIFDEGEVGWPDPPPFRAPVFVLTHQPREPWVRRAAAGDHPGGRVSGRHPPAIPRHSGVRWSRPVTGSRVGRPTWAPATHPRHRGRVLNDPDQQTAEGATRAGRREWVGLAVLALACLLYAMDLTVLRLAVPALSADLRPSSADLQHVR